MKKEIVGHTPNAVPETIEPWLDLDSLARVQLSSEDPAHPIEAALQGSSGIGWKAASPGLQTIWLHFEVPQAIHELNLRFEAAEQRTHEFVVHCSHDVGRTYREIVRQQFNFSAATMAEEENYLLNLGNVTDLKLTIVPDISGGDTRASLRSLRIR